MAKVIKTDGGVDKTVHTLVIEVNDNGLGKLLNDTLPERSQAGICPQCSSNNVMKVVHDANVEDENGVNYYCICRSCKSQFVEYYRLAFEGQTIDGLFIKPIKGVLNDTK